MKFVAYVKEGKGRRQETHMLKSLDNDNNSGSRDALEIFL